MARPIGPIAQAMLRAAGQGPATIKQLAARAQVGFAAARYTAVRLVARGDLVVVDKHGRPAVVKLPEIGAAAHGTGSAVSLWNAWPASQANGGES